jgi:hypothetical protein
MKPPEDGLKLERNMQQLLNKTSVNNSIGLFFIVVLTARIAPIMIHNRMQFYLVR